MANQESDQIKEFDPSVQRAVKLAKLEEDQSYNKVREHIDAFLDHLEERKLPFGIDPLTRAWVVRTEDLANLEERFPLEDITEQRNRDLENRQGVRILTKNLKSGHARFFDYEFRCFGQIADMGLQLFPKPGLILSPMLTDGDDPTEWIEDGTRYPDLKTALRQLSHGKKPTDKNILF